jgi:hypothetical protein
MMLETYSEWTQRLRQSMSLMFEAMLFKKFADSTGAKEEKDLGLQEVVKRRDLGQSTPDDSFTVLDGKIIEDSEQAVGPNITIAKYRDAWGVNLKEVVLEYRSYDKALELATESQDKEMIDKPNAPIRNLAWLLHESPFPDNKDDGAIGGAGYPTLLTLRCIGYLDQPGENRFQFIYEPPRSRVLQDKSVVTTLHSLINNMEPPTSLAAGGHFLHLWNEYWSTNGQGHKAQKTREKPSLGNRFFLAHAPAVTVLNIHNSGWVHKNLWSHGVIVFLIVNSSRFSRIQRLVPYVAGWGVARPISVEETDLRPDIEIEPNL